MVLTVVVIVVFWHVYARFLAYLFVCCVCVPRIVETEYAGIIVFAGLMSLHACLCWASRDVLEKVFLCVNRCLCICFCVNVRVCGFLFVLLAMFFLFLLKRIIN